MGEFLTFKHSFNSGDLITVLPGIQKLWRETGKKFIGYQRLDLPAYYFDDAKHPIKDGGGAQVCMNEKTFYKMKPLLEEQQYIEKFEIWEGQAVDFDFDLTRQDARIPLPGGDIHAWATLIFPQLTCDLGLDWIEVSAGYDYGGRTANWYGRKHGWYIVVNFTERYRNPYIDYHFLKDHQGDLIFVGLAHEHELFCEKWGLQMVPKFNANNFLDIAKLISKAKIFLGNQSFCWHLADAQHIPRILEVCSSFPNTFPTGNDGHAFVTQNALEYFFEQLIKK